MEKHKKTVKRKFFHWAVKWFYNEESDKEVRKTHTPEVNDVYGLLSSIGFKLRRVDMGQDVVRSQNVEGQYGCRVVVTCAHSGMRVIMETDDAICRCPQKKDDEDSSNFWQVSGSAPTSSQTQLNQIKEAGSSLLPKVEPSMTEVIEEILNELFLLMAEPISNKPIQNKISHASSLGQLPLKHKPDRHSLGSTTQHYRSLDTLMAQDEEVQRGASMTRLDYLRASLEAMEVDEDIHLKDPNPQVQTASPSLERQYTWNAESSCSSLSSTSDVLSATLKSNPDLGKMIKNAIDNSTNCTEILNSILDSINFTKVETKDTTDGATLKQNKKLLNRVNAKKSSVPSIQISNVKVSKPIGTDLSKSKFKRPSTLSSALLHLSKKSHVSVSSSSTERPDTPRHTTMSTRAQESNIPKATKVSSLKMSTTPPPPRVNTPARVLAKKPKK